MGGAGDSVAAHPGGRLFASLRVPNYRKFFFGALTSNIGTWMQNTAQGWLVLTVLTNNSSAALGLVTALQFLFVPLLAPWAGALADRLPKRRILLVTQSLMALNAGVLAVLVHTGVVTLWLVFAFALFQGLVTAFDQPARQSFVSEIVADTLLPNAVGLNGTSFNGARLIGPGIAGLIIGYFGIAPALYINAISYIAMLVGLISMQPAQLHPAPVRRGGGSVMEGLRYIKSRRDIVLVMVIVFMLSTFGMNFQINNATMATRVFQRGAEEYGLLGTVLAVGTLAGALMAARREGPRLRVILTGLAGFALCATVLALSPSYLMYGLMLIPVGYCMLSVTNTANSTVQLSTPPVLRGRVMAIYMAIFNGGTPIGASFIGWIGDVLGPRWAILMGSILAGLTCAGALVYLWRNRGLRASVDSMWPPRVTVWSVQHQDGTSVKH